jgi:predicted ATPase/DNA-binding winged helix-turn-helix (wHTH) protein
VRFVFDDFVVDTERLLVQRAGEVVHAQPQVFDVLAYLLLHRDRVVTKEELLDNVWGDRFVSESALTSRIKSARQLVGDDGSTQAYIATVHGRGYRWIAPTSVSDEGSTESGRGSAQPDLVGVTSPPVPLTSFVGRLDDVARISTALSTHRLVTVVGPPGVGKTRLVIETARQVGDERVMQVVFVDLRPAHSAADVLGVLRTSLGLGHHPQMPEPHASTAPADVVAVLRELRDRRVLLVLDNCEHVAEEARVCGAEILPSCPTVTILATSRRSLGLDGEAVVVIDPLPTVLALGSASSPWDAVIASDAGRLFVERAAAAGARWRRTAEEAADVATICRRLDGLPLAIELAAARSRLLATDELIRQLDTRLAAGGHSEHFAQALDASLRASRDLLDPDVARGFDALSVFDGSFTLEGAVAVIGSVCPERNAVDVLGELVDHSLVGVIDGPARRYRMLQAVQQFARASLRASGLEPAAIDAHVSHHLALVERHCPPATISGCSWRPLDDELTELLAAIERATISSPEHARRLVGAIGWYWLLSGHAEVGAACCRALGVPGEDPGRWTAGDARFVWAWSNMLKVLGEHAVELAEAAHAAAMRTGEWRVAAWSLVNVVAPDWMWLELDAVTSRWDEIVELFRRSGDRRGEAWAMVYVLGWAQTCAGHDADACATFERAVELFDAEGDGLGLARALLELAEHHLRVGHLDAARACHRKIPHAVDRLPVQVQARTWWIGGALAESAGRFDEAVSLHRRAFELLARTMPGSIETNTLRCMLARALRRTGEPHEALRHYDRAIEFVVRSDLAMRWQHGTWVLESLAGVLGDLGRAGEAAELFGAAAAGREQLSAAMPYWDRPGYDADVAATRDQLDAAVADRCWQAGTHLGLEAACRRASDVIADVLAEDRRDAVDATV